MEPSSKPQIDQLNASRPVPKIEHVPTPGGSYTKEVDEAANREKNQQIDRNIARMKERLKRDKGRAREAFERSR